MENQIFYMLFALGVIAALLILSPNFRLVLKLCIFKPKCECKLIYQGRFLKEFKDL